MMLTIEGLNAWYNRHHVLRDVSLSVDAGELVCVIGPNGAGKTSLMHAVLGVGITRKGQVRHQSDRIDHLPTHAVVRRGISLIPTGRQLFPHMSIRENLMIGGQAAGKSAADDFDRVYGYFPVLRERQGQLAGTLSGGEQQMLAIGRGLMSRPKLLLIDEPSMGLAPKIVTSISEIITRLNKEGMTVLLVEQNAALALAICDRVYVLENGRVVNHGTSIEVGQSVDLRQSYLGL